MFKGEHFLTIFSRCWNYLCSRCNNKTENVLGFHVILVSLYPSKLVSYCHSILVSWCPGVLVSWYPSVLVCWYSEPSSHLPNWEPVSQVAIILIPIKPSIPFILRVSQFPGFIETKVKDCWSEWSVIMSPL